MKEVWKMKLKFRNQICYLMLLMMVLLCVGCGKKESTDVKPDESSATEQMSENRMADETTVTEPEEVKENPKAVFPMVIEDGKITVESVFQYSGINPDYNEEICEEIGALQLKNTSAEYLESADITVKLLDQTELEFRVEDIPAGASVIAFETKNTIYDDEKTVEEILADAAWQQTDSLLIEEKMSFAIDGISILATNTSDEVLQNVVVKYHCSLDGIYFGGKSYEAALESVGPQESVTLDAAECYLGEAAVANVVY